LLGSSWRTREQIPSKIKVGRVKGKAERLTMTRLALGEPEKTEPEARAVVMVGDVLKGALWSLMEPYGALWSLMEPYGALWSLMEPDGARWSPMEPDGAQWKAHLPKSKPYGALTQPSKSKSSPTSQVLADGALARWRHLPDEPNYY